MRATPVDFLIFTPLAEERDALLDRLPGSRKLPPAGDDIRTYYEAAIPTTTSSETAASYAAVIVPLARMGHTDAASAATNAISRWQPRYVLLVGIAGGIKSRGVAIGDVLIADQVVDYEVAKITHEGVSPRPRVHPVDERLLIAAQNFTSTCWQHNIKAARFDERSPVVHFGPICTGNKVIAVQSPLQQLLGVWPKLIGIEMEAAGIASAATQSTPTPGFFMVRGVSDLVDGKDETEVKRWRPYACEVAAAWAVEFLKSGPVPIIVQESPCGTSRTAFTPLNVVGPMSDETRYHVRMMLELVLRQTDRKDDRQAFIKQALGAGHPVFNQITPDQWGGHADSLAQGLTDALALFEQEPAQGRHVVNALNCAVSDPKRPFHRNSDVAPHWVYLDRRYGTDTPFPAERSRASSRRDPTN